MKTDPTAASQSLATLFKRSTAPVFITSLANDRAESRRLPPQQIVTRDCGLIEKFLTRWDRPERALYFCVATLKPGMARRAKENLGELVCLHADLDFKNIVNTREEIEHALATLPMRPSLVVFSGHGLHLYWLLQEALSASRENIGRVEAALKKIANVLAGDPAVCECARLMRLPGSHNSKGGDWIDVVVVKQSNVTYPLERIEAWLATAQPLLQRRPGAKTPHRNTNAAKRHHDTSDPYAVVGREQVVPAPIDVDERLAQMQHRGPDETGIHVTQLSVSAAMLLRGWSQEKVVQQILQATAHAAGREGAGWNWRAEERKVRGMCRTWISKHPQVTFEVDGE